MDLNVNSVLDDVTSGGREFHVRDAAARKARSPTVRRHVKRTTIADVNDERSMLLTQSSALALILPAVASRPR